MEPWSLQSVILKATLVVARVGSIMTFAPFFSGSAIPLRVKGALTLAVAALLYPAYASYQPPLTTTNWLTALCGELVVGLVIGLALAFVYEGAQLAGQILGFQLGFSLANIIDPQSEVETPVLSTFHQIVALFLFLQLGVHHWILRALARSLDYLGPGSVALKPPTAIGIAQLAGGMLLIAVQIAAPALLATILADLAIALLGRTSPQLPVLFVGLSVKSLLGYAILLAAVAFWPGALEAHFGRAIVSAERLLHLTR